MASMRPGDHGSTFGGNPVSCAAALAGIDAMAAEELPAHAAVLGARAMERLTLLAGRHPELRVRGLGLMIGIELVDADDARVPRLDLALAIQRRMREDGVLVICSGADGNVIRVLPPLVITDAELGRALDVFEAATEAAVAEAGQPPASSSR